MSAQNAGVDVQKFHDQSLPWYRFVTNAICVPVREPHKEALFWNLVTNMCLAIAAACTGPVQERRQMGYFGCHAFGEGPMRSMSCAGAWEAYLRMLTLTVR